MLQLLTVLAAVLMPLFARAGDPATRAAVVSNRTAPPAAPAGAARPLPFLYDVYTFRGDHGTTVVAAYAVEAGELEREVVAGGVRYRFDVSIVLADTAVRRVIDRHDSVYVDLPRPLPANHLLFTAIEVQSPPSTTTLRRVYMYNATAPGIGQLHSAPFRVPDYSGTHLMLSDVALGQPDAAGGWRRGDVTLALLPTQQFPASAFEVYYEIYNLPRGHDYRTEIAIAEVDATGAAAATPIARLRFTSESAASGSTLLPELRRVETSLDRGRYRITVTVTDLETGASASTARTFEVHAGRRSATMVPTMPVAASGRRSR